MTSDVAGTARHGTMPAVNRHRKLGEDKCAACLQHSRDWGKAKYLREKSGYRLSMAEALAELGLPASRVPSGEFDDLGATR